MSGSGNKCDVFKIIFQTFNKFRLKLQTTFC